MRDRFWCLLEQIRYDQEYYQRYRRDALIVDNCFAGLSLIAACGSIAAWNVWTQIPWLWAIIIAVAQISQIVRPLLPYSKRLSALKHLLPDLRQLFGSIDKEWNKLQGAADADYQNSFNSFAQQFIDLKSKYLGDDAIPDIERISTPAWAECKHYLETNYFKGGNIDVKQETRSTMPKSASITANSRS